MPSKLGTEGSCLAPPYPTRQPAIRPPMAFATKITALHVRDMICNYCASQCSVNTRNVLLVRNGRSCGESPTAWIPLLTIGRMMFYPPNNQTTSTALRLRDHLYPRRRCSMIGKTYVANYLLSIPMLHIVHTSRRPARKRRKNECTL